MATAPFFFATPKLGLVQIVNGDASNLKTLVTAGSSGSKVVSIMAQTDETSARDLTLGITRSATFYPIGTVTVAIGSGNSGTVAAVNLLTTTWLPGLPLDSDGQPYIFLLSGDTLQVKSLTTVTNAKTITLSAVYGDG
jgi:hypothetical protein